MDRVAFIREKWKDYDVAIILAVIFIVIFVLGWLGVWNRAGQEFASFFKQVLCSWNIQYFC